MTRLRLLLLLLPVVLIQTGCGSSSNAGTASAPSDLDANGQPVSSVPWNKPESWETQGQLGALGH
jgi:hypothetical protein